MSDNQTPFSVLKRDAGLVVVRGRVYGGLAVYRHESGDWLIVHVPTGRTLCGADTREDAMSLVNSLKTLPLDWTTFNPQAVDPTIKTLILEIITP